MMDPKISALLKMRLKVLNRIRDAVWRQGVLEGDEFSVVYEGRKYSIALNPLYAYNSEGALRSLKEELIASVMDAVGPWRVDCGCTR